MQTDWGGEYVNEGMTELFGKRGMVHRNTAGLLFGAKWGCDAAQLDP